MMTKNHSNERKQLEMLTIEKLVPKDHLVRELDTIIDKDYVRRFQDTDVFEGIL